MAVLADVESGDAALHLLAQHQQPDVLLTDIHMDEMNGIKLIELVREKYPGIKVMALSMVDDIHTVFEVLHVGGSGYLVKDSSCDEVLFGIRRVANGEKRSTSVYLWGFLVSTVISSIPTVYPTEIISSQNMIFLSVNCPYLNSLPKVIPTRKLRTGYF